ncbi:MAG: hypothetical protein QOJ11_2808 [Frankiales bacterium]|jgi:hypothetical protein|nr:hypothetical protein [Frankiales bacterium]
MKPHEYSVISCHPRPSTGERLNLGVIVGSPSSGEWALRLLKDQRRVARFAGADALGACLGVVAELTELVAANDDALESGLESSLDADWLRSLAADHNNLIRFDQPIAVMADSLDEALDRAFRFRLEEPPRRESSDGWLTRNTLKAAQREALSDVPPALLREGAELLVGASVSSRLDFAVANGHALLLTHGWSFLVGGVAEVGTQVKAWAYAIERLRGDEAARLLNPDGSVSEIAHDVRLAVLVSSAATPEQRQIRDESLQVLGEINAEVVPYGEEPRLRELAAQAAS